jgi:hypothetical protein
MEILCLRFRQHKLVLVNHQTPFKYERSVFHKFAIQSLPLHEGKVPPVGYSAMSKRQFKAQASSGRAGTALGSFGSSAFGTNQSSTLSYIQEPIDYSAIDDPNVVVAFKNLSKKDGTTKAKALEDLVGSVSPSDALITDAFLEIWVSR